VSKTFARTAVPVPVHCRPFSPIKALGPNHYNNYRWWDASEHDGRLFLSEGTTWKVLLLQRKADVFCILIILYRCLFLQIVSSNDPTLKLMFSYDPTCNYSPRQECKTLSLPPWKNWGGPQNKTSVIRLHGWLRWTVVERWSLIGELYHSHARPAADGWPLMWVNRPLYRSANWDNSAFHPSEVDKLSSKLHRMCSASFGWCHLVNAHGVT